MFVTIFMYVICLYFVMEVTEVPHRISLVYILNLPIRSEHHVVELLGLHEKSIISVHHALVYNLLFSCSVLCANFVYIIVFSIFIAFTTFSSSCLISSLNISSSKLKISVEFINRESISILLYVVD